MYQDKKDDLLNKYKNLAVIAKLNKLRNGGGIIPTSQITNAGKNMLGGMKGVLTGNYPKYGSMNQPQANTMQTNTPSVQTQSIKPQAPITNTTAPTTTPTTTPTTMSTASGIQAPSQEFMNNMGLHMSTQAPTSQVGNFSLPTQSVPTTGALDAASGTSEGASTAANGASKALGTAGGALSVGLDAKNMFDNGINFNNATDMAADAATLGLTATGVGAPVAAAIQAAKFIKNLITGAIDKKRQKAMAQSQKAAAEEQARSEIGMEFVN